MGYQDLIMTIPPILLAQWTITDPVTTSLSTARVYGSNDPNYGTTAPGFVPPLDGTQSAYIYTIMVGDNDTVEANRIWSTYGVNIFLAIEHADTATVVEDYHLINVAYIEQARQVVAANRRLYPASLALYPTSGDVRWVMTGAEIMDRHYVLGVPFYGAMIKTKLLLINTVNYQQ